MKTQQYQLVLQFPCNSTAEFAAIVALEDRLAAEFCDSAVDVDGHDVGSAEANIFIFTPEPSETFRRAQAVVDRTSTFQAVLRAAYRRVDSDEYSVLWPPGEIEFTIA